MTAIRMSVCVAALLTLAITARPAAAFPIEFILTDANGKKQELSEYWVGLFCDEVGDDLRAHIDLPEGQGVIVRKVFDDSAAAKAGFQIHDILLKAGKTKLATPLDLMKAVQRAKGESLTIEVLRKGKKTSIKVTPQKRPLGQRFTSIRTLEPDVVEQLELEKRRLIEQLMKQQKDVRIQFVEPGKVVPGNRPARSAVPLPNGVSVSITRTNNEPAKISVKRGKESWDVTENELDKLPEDIRPGVKAMLNNNASIRLRLREPGIIDRPIGAGGGSGQIVIRKFDESETKTVEKQLDEDDNVKDLAEELRKLAEKIEKAQKKK
jgi:membrane-associated protease RseP (regulator of RpoE activity)